MERNSSDERGGLLAVSNGVHRVRSSILLVHVSTPRDVKVCHMSRDK